METRRRRDKVTRRNGDGEIGRQRETEKWRHILFEDMSAHGGPEIR